MPSIWGMGKEVFDKAIGGSNPSKPTESSTPGSGLFGSMKRSLSSSMAPNSSTEPPMVPEKDSVALQTRSKTEPALSDPFLVDSTVSSLPNSLSPGEKSESEKVAPAPTAPGDITIKADQSDEKAVSEVKDHLVCKPIVTYLFINIICA
ncbi:hypothetical protein CPB86DRAFT_54605 [Serendipita vermifera]|nr:hypothetical protein CPB86DRAFT_54605 [Serendipita vermifera]